MVDGGFEVTTVVEEDKADGTTVCIVLILGEEMLEEVAWSISFDGAGSVEFEAFEIAPFLLLVVKVHRRVEGMGTGIPLVEGKEVEEEEESAALVLIVLLAALKTPGVAVLLFKVGLNLMCFAFLAKLLIILHVLTDDEVA